MSKMINRIKSELRQAKTLLQFSGLKVIGQTLTMITPMVIAKFFSPDTFGSYSLAKMIVFFFTSILITSSQTPFIVLANKEQAKTGKINETFTVQFIFFLASIIIFSSMTLIFYKQFANFISSTPEILPAIILGYTGIALKTLLCNTFLATDKKLQSAWTEFIFGLSNIIIILFLLYTNKINLQTVFLTYFISSFFLVLISGMKIELKLITPLHFNKSHFLKMLNFTKCLVLGATAGYLINWGDNLVLKYYVTIESIGYYNLAYQIFKGISMLFLIIGPYFNPLVSRNINQQKVIANYWNHKRPRIIIASVLFILTSVPIITVLLNIIYGNQYSNAIPVMQLLIFCNIPIVFTVFHFPVLYAMNLYKLIQYLSFTQFLINIILNLILVPVLGIIGAAISTIIAYIVRAIFFEIYFNTKIKKRIGIC